MTNKNKGIISLSLASVLAGSTILISVFVSYFGSQISSNNRVGEIEGNVKVLMNEDININKRFDTLEENLKHRFDSLEDLIKAQYGR